MVSNAADALEKLRHIRLTAEDGAKLAEEKEGDRELEVRLSLDPEAKTFTIQDNGIGMSEEEINRNLGTIARSGSKAFVEELTEGKEGGEASASTKDRIIGQFGVGFYSAFMVGTKVRVYTRSAKEGSTGYCWTSTG